jgi:hypothetical protein
MDAAGWAWQEHGGYDLVGHGPCYRMVRLEGVRRNARHQSVDVPYCLYNLSILQFAVTNGRFHKKWQLLEWKKKILSLCEDAA